MKQQSDDNLSRRQQEGLQHMEASQIIAKAHIMGAYLYVFLSIRERTKEGIEYETLN